MALSVFMEEENYKKSKVTCLTTVSGANVNANLTSGVSKPKAARKHKISIKKGVHLSSKYMSAKRN